jgi:hypothetical protein
MLCCGSFGFLVALIYSSSVWGLYKVEMNCIVD